MKENGTQAVRCPLCRKGRIIDAASGTDVSRLRLYSPRQARKAEWFAKCPKCGEQIGLTFQKIES